MMTNATIIPSMQETNKLHDKNRQPKELTLAERRELGKGSYETMKAKLLSDPEVKAHYEELIKQRDLASQLAQARKEAGISQQELANRMGVSQVQVSRLEKIGYQSYTLKSIEKYLTALKSGYELEVRVIKTPAKQKQLA